MPIQYSRPEVVTKPEPLVLLDKTPDSTALVVGEHGQNILAVVPRVRVPLWEVRVDKTLTPEEQAAPNLTLLLKNFLGCISERITVLEEMSQEFQVTNMLLFVTGVVVDQTQDGVTLQGYIGLGLFPCGVQGVHSSPKGFRFMHEELPEVCSLTEAKAVLEAYLALQPEGV